MCSHLSLLPCEVVKAPTHTSLGPPSPAPDAQQGLCKCCLNEEIDEMLPREHSLEGSKRRLGAWERRRRSPSDGTTTAKGFGAVGGNGKVQG